MGNDVFNKPIFIFVLGGLLAFGGSYVTTQQASQASVTSNSVRLSALEDYVTEHKRVSVTQADLSRVEKLIQDTQRNYVTKDEFNAAFSSLLRAVTELRDEVRDSRRR
jgi:hypothetical protein